MFADWLANIYLIGDREYILHPRLYFLYDLTFIINGALSGPANALFRIGSSLFINLIHIYRVDLSIMVPPFDWCDYIHAQYTSVVRIYYFKQDYKYSYTFQWCAELVVSSSVK